MITTRDALGGVAPVKKVESGPHGADKVELPRFMHDLAEVIYDEPVVSRVAVGR
jgi:hypothetical protein